MKPSVTDDKIKEFSAFQEKFFEDMSLSTLAKSSGFIRRDRIITGEGFMKMCFLGTEADGFNASLTQLSTLSTNLGI